MQWVVYFLVAVIWATATDEWGWNGWVAFVFAIVCAGVLAGIWEAVFGTKMLGDNGNSDDFPPKAEKDRSFTDTALKMGAGYGIGKLIGKKTYAYKCRNCNHYEERSQREKIGVKCPRCGIGGMQITKI